MSQAALLLEVSEKPKEKEAVKETVKEPREPKEPVKAKVSVPLHPAALLTADECRAAEKDAITGDITGETLMENAGKALLDLITHKFKPRPVLIVCGTGNNGGDGFILARMLKEKNWQVTLAILGNAEGIKGDAKKSRDKWNMSGGAPRTFAPDLLKESQLVVDAIFGTGLDRPIEGDIKKAIDAINASKQPVVSVDIASGINTDTGIVMGTAIKATHTVTFVRAKPGHILLPGKANMGELHVYDIGIAGDKILPTCYLNAPALWKNEFPTLAPDAHKYSRGHSLVIGGGMNTTGASRLAALSALRVGSGLVSVACTQSALPIYAMTLTAVMTQLYSNASQLAALLDDSHITATLVGPGCGVSDTTKEQVLQLLATNKACVIDADGISVFHNDPKELFTAIATRPCVSETGSKTVLTPHEGEFARIFDFAGSRTQRVKQAAKLSKSVVLLKGNDTVIASPDGRVAINANAPVWLATAGSGDTLAGIVTGLMGQGMPAFEAACAGVWIHGEAAMQFGPGLIAEDLPDLIPHVLKNLYND